MYLHLDINISTVNKGNEQIDGLFGILDGLKAPDEHHTMI